MSYILEHTTLGFCWWDLPALIVLILVIVAVSYTHMTLPTNSMVYISVVAV